MSLVRTRTAPLARDPFGFARDLFDWDPFVVARSQAAFTPTFEVKETQDAYILKADVPGVDEKDLEIALHDGVLTVRGQRAAEQRKDGERYSLSERRYGSFARSFALPDHADGDKIEAKLEAGVLTLSVGKRAETKPRKIALSK